MKIVLAGPPRSGKSCLRYALRQAVFRLSNGTPYLYTITAAPDGEGAWFHETCQRSTDEAIALRDRYKYFISEEFTQRLANAVACCDQPLTAIDIGGRVSDENRRICRAATHAILIAGDRPAEGGWSQRLVPWRDFCTELGLEVLAELHSDYDAERDEIQGVDAAGTFHARVHRLERGEPLEERPAIMALAQHILAQLNLNPYSGREEPGS